MGILTHLEKMESRWGVSNESYIKNNAWKNIKKMLWIIKIKYLNQLKVYTQEN